MKRLLLFLTMLVAVVLPGLAFSTSSGDQYRLVTSSSDITLGEEPQERAEEVVFSVLETDETGDPKVIEDRLLTALSQEFGVERGAFHVETSFIVSSELLREDYEPWGLSAESGNTMWNYKGETIRTFEDKMVGHYQSSVEGKVDVSVQRDRCGKITSVTVWKEGDPEYDARTRKYYKEDASSKSYRSEAYPSESSTVWEE